MVDVWPIQQAVYAALVDAPATYPVYDAVPQGAAFPYIVLGAWSGLPDDELEVASVDASLTIHVWSRTAGKMQAHAMLEFIRERLDGQDVSGAWACTEDAFDVFEDPSSTAASRLYHGFARYRLRAN